MQPRSGLAPSVSAGILRLARLKTGLSQQDFARRAGISATMVSSYERGMRDATLGTLLRLVNAAGLDLRIRLEPLEDHDASLAELQKRRTTRERRRDAERLALWRGARPVR